MAKYQGVSTLEILEGARNYNNWIAQSIIPYAQSPILEIGSGIGNISSYFTQFDQVTFSDADIELVRILKKRFNTTPTATVAKYDVLTHPATRFNHKFNTVFSVNVLEHIENDILALRNIHKAIVSGGKVILLVPAKRFAYSSLDRSLGHFRRYEKKELKDKVESSGFIIEKLYYFNFVGLLSWIIRDRIIKNEESLAAKHVSAFDWIVPFLHKIEDVVEIPVGISLICIARKK